MNNSQNFQIQIIQKLTESQRVAVRGLLRQVVDYDGNMPVGEHIYLKLKAGPMAGEDETAFGLLAYQAQNLIGYAQFLVQPDRDRLSGEVVVDPQARRQGVGQALLTQAAKIGREHKLARLDLWAYNFQSDSAAEKLAYSVGMSPNRTLLHLRRPISEPLPKIELPADLRIRPFRVGEDETEWLEVNRLAFADHPENGSWTRADLQLRYEQPWFDPADLLILEDTPGQMLGFHWTKLHPMRHSDLYTSPIYVTRPATLSDEPELHGLLHVVEAMPLGEVYIVGLHPIAQGRKLGYQLTLIGLHHLKKRGAGQFSLYVEADNNRARLLYDRLGFELHHTDIAFSQPLSDS